MTVVISVIQNAEAYLEMAGKLPELMIFVSVLALGVKRAFCQSVPA